MPGTKPPPSTRAFFQVYVSAARAVRVVGGAGFAARAGGVPASKPAASASTAVRMRVLRTGGPLLDGGERRDGRAAPRAGGARPARALPPRGRQGRVRGARVLPPP